MSQIMGDKITLNLAKASRNRVCYEIVLRGDVIGEIELDQITWRSGEAELRIAIPDQNSQGRGYGTDAVSTLLTHAFEKMRLQRVYLRVYASNAIALRCYAKAGFKAEGRLVRSTEQDGPQEILLMAVDRPSFWSNQQNREQAV